MDSISVNNIFCDLIKGSEDGRMQYGGLGK